MEAPLVLKFGGAALSSGVRIRTAAERVAAATDPIVVVSAVGNATDALERAVDIAPRADAAMLDGAVTDFAVLHRSLVSQLGLDPDFLNQPLHELRAVLASIRERGVCSAAARDFVLSFGERISARLFARVLRDMGTDGTPVDAFDLGLVSDSNYGRARPLPDTFERVARALEEIPGVPVITGFVAADADGRVTTLGRDGTDLTASWIGAAVGAREVQFWKWVAGIATADPNRVPEARPLEKLSYTDARAMARWGARVLHPDAIDPLERASIPARVLSAASTPVGESAGGTSITSGRAGRAFGVSLLTDLVLVRGPRAGFRTDAVLWSRPAPQWAGLFPESLAPAEQPLFRSEAVACVTAFGGGNEDEVSTLFDIQRIDPLEIFSGEQPSRVHALIAPRHIDAALTELHLHVLARRPAQFT